MKTILAGLFAVLVLASLLIVTIQAANRTLSSSAGGHCAPLPPPTGPTVTVSSESELRSQAYSAAPGTTIMVSAGTYNLQNIVHVVNSSITIRGTTGNRDDVILDVGGMGTGHTHGVLIDADDVTIADLTIRNAGEHGVSIQGSDRPTLYNLHIVDTGNQLVKVNPWGDGSEDGLLACSRLEYTTTAPDDYTNGISAHRAHHWVVRDNQWYRIRTPGNAPVPTILFWSESTDTVVERNLLVDCYQGIAFGNPGQSGVNHSGGIVRNNFIYSGLEHDVAVEMTRAQGWLVANNTALLLNPAPGLTWGMEARYSESEGTFAYNLTNMSIWHDRDGGQGDLVGNVTTAQSNWFVDAAAGDLHLLPTATAAIDQASPLAQVTDDFDGDPRPIGPAPDVGADEYGSPSSTATPTPTPTSTATPGTPTATPTNPPCDLDGDLDGDGDVDIADIMLVASLWHTAEGDPDYEPDYDLDSNGKIDIVDIMLVAIHWGETCPSEGDAQVWAVGNTRKVLPTNPVEEANYVWSAADRSVRIKAARNEHEPFQLIIATDGDPLSGVNVTASDLVGFNGTIGTISQDNITLYRQTYFEVTQPSDPWGTGMPAAIIPPGRIPDALIPFADPYDPGHSVGTPFAVSVGENQPVWVNIYVPADAAPGEYSGALTITADGGATVLDTVTLNLTVWDFALPETTTLDANFPLDTFWTLPPQYEIDEDDQAALYALTDKYYEGLLDHRLHPFELYRRPAYSEANGTIQLDFSASDPQYEYFLEARGMSSFNLPGVYDDYDEQYLIRDAAGKRYTAAAFDDPVFTDKVTQYYQLLRDHFTAQGWFDRHFTFFSDETQWVSDEPMHNGPDGLQRLLDWASLVKGVSPDFKVATASVYPIPPGPPDRGWVDLVGYVDEWEIAPDEVEQDPETYRQRVALGETLGLYFNDYGDFIDYKATLHRALGSLAYKYDATVVVGWAVAAWVGDATTMDAVNPWLSTPDPVFGNGAGALFWPGHKIEGDPAADVDGPLPSIRLELAREAAEDYEYLTMLAAQTSEAFARSLAVNLLPQPLRDADPDPEAFYALRDLMGEILSGQHPVNLATIQGTVTESGSGAPLAGILVSNGQGAALTDDDGTYTLAVEVGDQTITASRDRYVLAQQAVAVGAGEMLTVDFSLQRVAEESTLLFSFETSGEVADWEFENVISQERTSQHVTEGASSLKVVFGDSNLPSMGTGQFPTDWSSFTALEFDVYNESDYYTYLYIGVGDNASGWYPQTGGDILLLPNASTHIVVPIAEMARDVDVSSVDWLEFEPETLMEEENYQGQTKTYPLGLRTLYFDNIRLVRVTGGP